MTRETLRLNATRTPHSKAPAGGRTAKRRCAQPRSSRRRRFSSWQGKCLLACGLTALSAQMAWASNKAYVFVGVDAIASETAANMKAADSAVANYQRQGYTVCRDNSPTQAEITAACNDPDARGLWMVGHGGKTPGGAYVPYFAYNTSAGATDRGVTPAALGAGTFGQFTTVTFHGCGQLLQPWADKFPNSLFTSWTGAVKAPAIRWDEWWRGHNRIPQKGGGLPEGGATMNPLMVDPRIEAGMPFMFFADIGLELDVPRNDYAAMQWCMPEALAIEFGSKTFNVVVTDGFEAQLSGGIAVVDGEVVGQVEGGYADPDFVYVMSPLAALETIANIDTLPDWFESGELVIADNTTGMDELLLWEGASNVLFGLFSEGCDGCEGDVDGDGVVSVIDMLAVLATWGTPDGDVTGDSTTDIADLLVVLAAWGPCE